MIRNDTMKAPVVKRLRKCLQQERRNQDVNPCFQSQRLIAREREVLTPWPRKNHGIKRQLMKASLATAKRALFYGHSFILNCPVVMKMALQGIKVDSVCTWKNVHSLKMVQFLFSSLRTVTDKAKLMQRYTNYFLESMFSLQHCLCYLSLLHYKWRFHLLSIFCSDWLILMMIIIVQNQLRGVSKIGCHLVTLQW